MPLLSALGREAPESSFAACVAEFSLALVTFLRLVGWRQPAWRVVLFCAGVGGLTLA